MRRVRLSIVLAFALSSVGCGHVGSMPRPALPVARPYVVQHGGGSWVQFSPATKHPNLEGITVGPDGNMWFAVYSDTALVRMTMSGTIREFPWVNGPFYAADVASAGNKIFVTGAANSGPSIGIFTTHGAVTTISAGFCDNSIAGIAPSPDKKTVWFSEGACVGNLTPTGAIKTYRYPSNSNNGGGEITPGPDGNEWFVENGLGNVGYINVHSHAITEFTTNSPTGGTCGLYDIATGSDGALYYPCNASGSTRYLGRMTTTGSQSYYLNTYGFSGRFQDIWPGPDGNIWFSSFDNINNVPELGEFDIVTQTFSVFAAPDSSYVPMRIMQGPDGNVWGTNEIGKVDVYVLNPLTVKPKSLSFTGPGLQKTISVTEPGTSSWSATTSDAAVATVAAGGSNDQFTVTSVGAGACAITVSDGRGNAFRVHVSVL